MPSAPAAVRRPSALEAGAASVARYEPYLDGLFTYCLSVMCEHDAATDSLGEALVVADRQRDRQRVPMEAGLYRPWLYSLARWACLRRLACSGGDSARTGPDAPDTALSEPVRTQRHRELSTLAWPEAAGTTPEQREALELAVRHGLPAPEVAAVLSLSSDAALALLSHAACEVERTRAALAVVETGGCPAVSRLAGDDRLLLGTALRRELVRHVDECAACRRVAESAMSGVGWPGTAPAGPGELPVLVAPRPALAAAVTVVRRARAQHNPRFDRAGFPLELKDRAARREKFRSRAVTTTVVATVLAAPVLALWAAYRGAPLTGEPDGSAVAAAEREDASRFNGHPYENAAQDGPTRGGHRGRPGESRASRGAPEPKAGKSERAGAQRAGAGGEATAGGLTVDARPGDGVTLITLTAAGGAPVRWSASADAPWVGLSRSGGVLRPGESYTLRAAVDHSREPARAWAAHIRIAPTGSVITLRGRGSASPSPEEPSPENPSPPPEPSPSDPPPPSEEPTPPPPEQPPSEEPPSSSAPGSPSSSGEPSGTPTG